MTGFGLDKKQLLLLTAGLLVIVACGLIIWGLKVDQPTAPLQTSTITSQPSSTEASASARPVNQNLYRVTKVIDGDTLEIEGHLKVRLIGINTPETVDPKRPIQCFGPESSDHLKQLLTDQQVRLEKDTSETDKFGRLLRYVFLNDLFVNQELVEDGFAYAIAYPPDIKYQKLFQLKESEAKQNLRGLWKQCQ